MTKLEQAARAAYDVLTGIAAEMRPGARFKSWAELPADQQSMQIKAARAVLESLREPSEEMVKAVNGAALANVGMSSGWMCTSVDAWRRGHNAMLDSILKEGT